MKYKILTAARTVLIASGLCIAGTSNASIITQWSFSTDSTFVGNSAVFGPGSGSIIENATELSWGSNSGNFQSPTANGNQNRSALTIGAVVDGSNDGDNSNGITTTTGGGPATGFINTTIGGAPMFGAGQIGLGTNFTHWNNPISVNFATLLRGSIFDTLTLTPIIPFGAPVAAPNLTFNFEFRETPNDANCAGGTPNPCGDLWGFSGTQNLNIGFNVDGQDYFASVFVLNENLNGSPISFLDDAQCSELGFTVGISGQRCQGFLTAEAASTTVQFGFAITTDRIQVPEPHTVALLGLSLLGLARIKKQRK